MLTAKEISKKDIDALIRKKFIRNTARGFVDRRGYAIACSRTRNKIFIEDKFADMARHLF